jgi:hypothetical protein
MADEASNQRHKRCLADESADQLASSRDQGMSPKLAEVVETLVEALNKRKRQRLNKAGSYLCQQLSVLSACVRHNFVFLEVDEIIKPLTEC